MQGRFERWVYANVAVTVHQRSHPLVSLLEQSLFFFGAGNYCSPTQAIYLLDSFALFPQEPQVVVRNFKISQPHAI